MPEHDSWTVKVDMLVSPEESSQRLAVWARLALGAGLGPSQLSLPPRSAGGREAMVSLVRRAAAPFSRTARFFTVRWGWV